MIFSALSCLLFVCQLFSQQPSPSKLESAIIAAHHKIETDTRSFFKNVESFIVVAKGNLALEKYYNGAKKDSLHLIQSQTKSIVSLLMGIAIDKGYVKDENELVAQYFPDEFGKDDGLKLSLRIKDVLTMSAGMDWEEMLPVDDPKNDNANMFRSGKWLQYALTRPMAKKPFIEFKYNSGCPMMIEGIIQKTTHMTLDDFAIEYLFEPLGIKEHSWQKDSTGFYHAGGGLSLKPIDMVKIGKLILAKGQWGGVQIVPESWIRKATQPYFVTTFSQYGYGYFWWVKDMMIHEHKTTKVISAQGAGGQYLYVFPEFDLVISFTEHNYGTPLVGPFIIDHFILPSLR